MKRIAILDDYQDCALGLADWSRLSGQCEITVFRQPFDAAADPGAVLEPYHIICAMRERTPFPAALLERLPNLELLVSSGRVNASIDTAAASRLGVVTAGTGSTGWGAAELTMALILALSRQLVPEHQRVRQGDWQQSLGGDLDGAVLGLMGLGRLGARVAGYAAAFGMRVIAWSQNLDAARAAQLGVEAVDRSTLFADSDYLSIHLRLSERTRGLVGKQELAQMKPSAYLVNTSRGEIVDEGALVEALTDGVIAGAGIDVFAEEPLPPQHPMREAPNLLATPHIGFVTRNTYRQFYGEMVRIIEDYLAGREVPSLN